MGFVKLEHRHISNLPTARWSGVAATTNLRCEPGDWNQKVYSGELMTRRIQALNQVVAKVQLLAKSANVSARLSGRVKSFESTWRKMQVRRLPYQSIFDLIGVRVIVDNADHCYQLLKSVHDSYAQLAGHERDYIATPKRNGYQSLHTTVRNANGMLIEVQLRTARMHECCEGGRASHRAYKASAIQQG